MELKISDDVSLSAQLVMTGRGCIIGQSGSGKSFLMGLVAEQLIALGLPFCIIDTEGEYLSLKNASSRVAIAGGPDADMPLSVDPSRLFRASISESMSLVIDVSDVVDKADTVYRFLNALYTLEESVRKPYLVLIEEADKFAPQIVHQKINMVEELSVRGRKRGIGLLIATQRPSSISKNVLSQCSYGFIGKLTIENDLNAISQLFSGRSALDEIVNLATGEFMPFGLGQKKPFRVSHRSSLHMGSTPQVGPVNINSGIRVKDVVKGLLSDGFSGDAKPKPSARTPDASLPAISFLFTPEDARKYAERVSRKAFGILGKRTETVDSIAKRYLPALLCRIRVPTGRKREFEEHSVLLGEERSMITLDGRTTVHRLGITPTKLSADEESMLRLIKSKRGIGKKELASAGLLKKGSAAAIRKLSSKKIIRTDGGVITSPDYSRYYLKEPPELGGKEPGVQTDGEPPTRKDAELLLKNTYPTCSILGCAPVLLPLYVIILRKGDKVRVFSLDGMHGKELLYA
jgi:hypothetical protein